MNRIGIYLLTMAAMLLTCCSKESEVTAEATGKMGKTLVVYYSYRGDCEQIVESLTAQTEAEVMGIEPADKTER